jgi:hypothetical protein
MVIPLMLKGDSKVSINGSVQTREDGHSTTPTKVLTAIRALQELSQAGAIDPNLERRVVTSRAP